MEPIAMRCFHENTVDTHCGIPPEAGRPFHERGRSGATGQGSRAHPGLDEARPGVEQEGHCAPTPLVEVGPGEQTDVGTVMRAGTVEDAVRGDAIPAVTRRELHDVPAP
jgi:hypothetical protein